MNNQQSTVPDAMCWKQIQTNGLIQGGVSYSSAESIQNFFFWYSENIFGH